MHATTQHIDTIELQAARYRLVGAIVRQAQDAIQRTGIRPFATEDAPNTYAELQAAYHRAMYTGKLPVWEGGSATSLYLSPWANHQFRYWHDTGHVENGLSFTLEDESELQVQHHFPLICKSVGIESLAAQLYWADTVGQLEYNARQGKFPTNQLAFDIAYVENPSSALNSGF